MRPLAFAAAIPEEIPLEFCQGRHEGSDELALRSAHIKLESGLSDQGNAPGLEIMKRLHQVYGAAPPTGQFRDEDGVDAPVLGQGEDALPLGALILGSGGYFFPDPHHLEAPAFGVGKEISFLAVAGLVGGGNPAVDGYPLSQLIPSDFRARKPKPGLVPSLYHYA